MRRSMIAVCLLLLSPSTVLACDEDHSPGAGWFDRQPPVWSSYGTGAEALHRDRALDVALFAGGLGVVILAGVCYRAMRAAAGPAPAGRSQPATIVPLALASDAPAFEPLCADPLGDFEIPDFSTPKSFDLHSSASTVHSPGIDSVATSEVFIWR
jgi:hypothetical protein